MTIGQISLVALLEEGTLGSRLLLFCDSTIFSAWLLRLLQKEKRESGQLSRQSFK